MNQKAECSDFSSGGPLVKDAEVDCAITMTVELHLSQDVRFNIYNKVIEKTFNFCSVIKFPSVLRTIYIFLYIYNPHFGFFW